MFDLFGKRKSLKEIMNELDEMIGTMYLNEFSYNERKKNPIRVE